MVKFFVIRIQLGKMTLEEVPQIFRAMVQAELEKEQGENAQG